MKLEELLDKDITLLVENPDIDVYYYVPQLLVDSDTNFQEYEKLSRKPNKKLLKKVSENANIYEMGYTIFCLDDRLKRVTYYMQFKKDNSNLIGEYYTQYVLWSSINKSMKYDVHIPSYIFWEFLVKKYHTILTDYRQSWAGSHFWQDRVWESLHDPKYYTYYVDFATREVFYIEDEIEYERLLDRIGDIWHRGKAFRHRRILITDHTIDTKQPLQKAKKPLLKKYQL